MIKIVEGSKKDLETIRPLWQKLCQWHQDNSTYFTEHFNTINYDLRLKHFLSADRIKIVLAYDDAVCVGYSVSTINTKSIGEIESLYLDAAYRGQQIGDRLMEIPLAWMEAADTKRIILGTSVGNEGVFPFYQKFGFYPRTTILERK